MAKLIISEAPPPGPAPAGTVILYARDDTLWAVDETGAEYRVPARFRNEEPVGTKDGVNDTFTLASGRKFVPDSLVVFLNGLAYDKNNIVEAGTFDGFQIVNDNLPNADDAFTITYTEGV